MAIHDNTSTFAAAATQSSINDEGCPCTGASFVATPSFVGEDYFCDSGVHSEDTSGFHPDDPLWNGKGCSSSSSCCSFNNPPHFTKTLPSPTSDPIEARLCRWESIDDIYSSWVHRALCQVVTGKMNLNFWRHTETGCFATWFVLHYKPWLLIRNC